MNHFKILIIDDSDGVIKSRIEGFKAFYEEEGRYSFLTEDTTNSVNEAVETIKEVDCNAIFLDHCLTNNGDEGLVIAEKIKNNGKLILSTTACISRTLINLYKEKGVMHFPGKNFIEIKKCLDGECKCYLL